MRRRDAWNLIERDVVWRSHQNKSEGEALRTTSLLSHPVELKYQMPNVNMGKYKLTKKIIKLKKNISRLYWRGLVLYGIVSIQLDYIHIITLKSKIKERIWKELDGGRLIQLGTQGVET